MTKIKDIMVKKVVSFKPSDPIHYVAWSLRDKKISGAPVLEERKVVGIISERDIMRLIEEHDIKINLFLPSPFDVIELPFRMKHELDEIMEVIKKTAKIPVEEIMTKKVITISPDVTVPQAAKIMGDKKINRLPVVDKKGNLVGIVTRGDIIGTLV
jgi:CBS domain-containing protein